MITIKTRIVARFKCNENDRDTSIDFYVQPEQDIFATAWDRAALEDIHIGSYSLIGLRMSFITIG